MAEHRPDDAADHGPDHQAQHRTRPRPEHRADAAEAGPGYETAAHTMPNPPLTGDALDLLTDDHRAMEALFVELEAPGTDARRRGDLADVLIAQISRHAAAEERHFYPAVRDHLPGGDQLVEQELREHAEVAELARRLITLEPGDAGFGGLAEELMGRLRQHMRAEETKLFPRLREACPPQSLVDLGERIRRTERHGPTLPHPDAPHSGAGGRVATPLLAALDHLTDALTDRPTRPADLRTGEPAGHGRDGARDRVNGHG